MNAINILFVDDEPRVLQAMNWIFRRLYRVLTADSPEKALAILSEHRIDIIVSDQKMPGMNGTSLLTECARKSPRTIRILMTGYSEFEAAVNAVNSGAVFRYIRKPWDNDVIRETIASAVVAAEAIKDDSEPVANEELEKIEESAGVLIVDDDNLFDEVADGLRASYSSHRAKDIHHAMDILEWHHVGVVIIESSPLHPLNMNFVKALKHFRPDIMTIVLTHGADIDEVIDLINLGQVYRFVRIPVKASSLRLSIDSAMRRHAQLVADPRLKKAHAVDKDALIRQLNALQEPVKSRQMQTEKSKVSSGWLGVVAKLKGLRRNPVTSSANANI